MAGASLTGPDPHRQAFFRPMRRRLRDLGYAVGRFPPGPLNAIVDVAGGPVRHRNPPGGDGGRRAAAEEVEASEGALGAGRGTTCFGFESGVGGASRIAGGGATLGCLVVTNYGGRRDARLLLGPGAPDAATPAPPAQGGSAIVVLA